MNAAEVQSAPGTLPIGRWLLTVVPADWTFLQGYGLRSAAPVAVPASVALTEDVLPGGDKLGPYIESQRSLLTKTFPLIQIAGPAPAQVAGADEAEMLILKHEASGGGTVYQIQTYALVTRWIGIATLTAAAEDLSPARAAMNEILAGLRILPESAERPPG